MLSLKGKTAVVTGGANGIGLAVTKKFLELDAQKIIVIDRDEHALSSLRNICLWHGRLCSSDHGRLYCLSYDIQSRDYASLKRQLDLAGGCRPIDILVNNAGIELSRTQDDFLSRDRSDSERWRQVLDVNVHGTRDITEFFLSGGWFRRSSGSIIFVTSVHTAFAFKDSAAYDASKHALVGYMRSIALRHGETGVRSNAIAPGAIYPTGMTAHIGEQGARELGERIPTGRCGTPEEVANVVAFVASDWASYINGAQIRVDGGLAIQNPFGSLAN